MGLANVSRDGHCGIGIVLCQGMLPIIENRKLWTVIVPFVSVHVEKPTTYTTLTFQLKEYFLTLLARLDAKPKKNSFSAEGIERARSLF